MTEPRRMDAVIEEISDYVLHQEIDSSEAFTTAGHVLLDTIGRGILALSYPECTKSARPDCPGNLRAQRRRESRARLLF